MNIEMTCLSQQEAHKHPNSPWGAERRGRVRSGASSIAWSRRWTRLCSSPCSFARGERMKAITRTSPECGFSLPRVKRVRFCILTWWWCACRGPAACSPSRWGFWVMAAPGEPRPTLIWGNHRERRWGNVPQRQSRASGSINILIIILLSLISFILFLLFEVKSFEFSLSNFVQNILIFVVWVSND